MPKEQDFKSTEVMVDGGIGGVRSVKIDGADYTPDVFSSDWLSAISMPARPVALILDIGTGIVVGSLISHGLLLIGTMFAPAFAILTGAVIITTLSLIFRYVSSMKNNWYTLSVYYRALTLILGFLSIIIW